MLSDEFGYLALNQGEISPMWKYTRYELGHSLRSKSDLFVRQVEKGYAYSMCDSCQSEKNPYYDLYDENIRCGRAAADRGAGVTTLNVNAGDELSFYGSFNGVCTLYPIAKNLAPHESYIAHRS